MVYTEEDRQNSNCGEVVMFRLLGSLKGIGLIIIAAIALSFMWHSHISLYRDKEVLKSKSQSQEEAIKIQCKVLDVVKNTKSVDFDRNIKRMQNGEL
jgi:hypothetical protein